MKPNASTISVTGHMPVQGRKMDFDPDSIAHIMRLLIDLYSDKELAIIRELSTNAIDSHIMAGVTEPIKVQTPTPLSPYLVIEDKGLGLAVDEIYALFGRYGASTKRDTNEATGMLGLGSKSPLTYTNQFTMTAIKDGVMAVVAIIREEDGVGNLTVVDTRATTDPNGVLIKIPAKQGHNLESKAKAFFQYWKKGTVTLNGVDPAGLGGTVMKITNDISLVQGDRYAPSESRIVMGNVPYPAPELSANELGLGYGSYHIVANVSIGDVDFAPSREALQDTKKTRETIACIKSDFKAGLQAAIQLEIDTAPSAFEALRKMMSWRELSTSDTFVWKGQALPRVFEIPFRNEKTSWGGINKVYDGRCYQVPRYTPSGYGRSRSEAYSAQRINVDSVFDAVFVTDFDMDKVTLSHRRKATQWAEKGPVSAARFFFIDKTINGLDLMPDDRKVKWSVIKQEKLPKVATVTSGRIPGSFDIVKGGEKNRHTPSVSSSYSYAPSDTGVPGDKLDQSYPIFFMHGNMQEGRGQIIPVMDYFYKKYTLICLPGNRLDKFKRENPKIKNAFEVLKDESKKITSKITDDEKKALFLYDSHLSRTLFRWASVAGKIDDPELRELLRIAAVNTDSILAIRSRFAGTVDIPTKTIKVVEIMKRYPLVFGRSNDPNSHAIRYVNAEYAWIKR